MTAKVCVGLLLLIVVGCRASPGSQSPVAQRDSQAPPPAEAPTRSACVLELTRLEQLRVGMRYGLGRTPPLPSTAGEIDAFGKSMGCSFDCAGEGSWFSDEEGVLEKLCGAEGVTVGRVTVWLRLHLMRFEVPGEDGIGRLRWIELVPPLAETSPGYRTYTGPRPAWSAVMGSLADHTYGDGRKSQAPSADYVVWRRPDRYVSLATPRTSDLAAALMHIGLDETDRKLFGVTD